MAYGRMDHAVATSTARCVCCTFLLQPVAAIDVDAAVSRVVVGSTCIFSRQRQRAKLLSSVGSQPSADSGRRRRRLCTVSSSNRNYESLVSTTPNATTTSVFKRRTRELTRGQRTRKINEYMSICVSGHRRH